MTVQQTPFGSVQSLPLWQALTFCGLAISMAFGLVLGSNQAPEIQLAFTLAVAALGSALLLWLWREPRFAAVPVSIVIGLAVLLRLIAMAGSPLLEDDYFRYLWDGYQFATTGEPYRFAPSAFFGAQGLSSTWQGILSGINYPEIPTIYGPVLELLFALAYSIAPAKLGAIQGVLLLLDVVLLLVLARAGVKTRWLLAYAVHPLILKEAMASAHPDGLVGLFLVLAIQAWRGGHARRLGVAMGLAVATKISALVVLPLFLVAPMQWRGKNWSAFTATSFGAWPLRVLVGTALCLALVYLPFVLQGGNELLALRQFGTDWRFNPLLYRFLEGVLPAVYVRPIAAVLLVAVITLLTLRWHQRQTGVASLAPPADIGLLLLLLLSPVVNPWYWLWALAPAVLLGNVIVVGIAACSIVSYLTSDHFLSAISVSQSNTWSSPLLSWGSTLFQLAVIGLLYRFDCKRKAQP